MTGRDPTFIRAVEERARRAWPAAREERLEGWVLRFAAGATRRANSVHAVDDVADVDAAIRSCTAAYRTRGLIPRIHLHPAVRPTDLDERLARAGWDKEVEACVHVAALEGTASRPAATGVDVKLFHDLAPAHLDAFAQWRGFTPQQWDEHAEILRRLLPERAFAVASEGGAPGAIGLAVYEAGWVGLFDIVTDPALRRRGLGRALVVALLRWGKERGAQDAYLQVVAGNSAALALYASLGFTEAYRYWYRRLPT